MANDDEKPDSGDDPWADLEAEGLPDLEGDFSFSFDEDLDAPPVPEPDVAEPDVAEPDVAEPDVAEPDVAEPDVAEPDVAEPDVPEPDVAEPDVAEPDVPEPDVPEPPEPDVAEPDVAEPDVAEPAALDTGEPAAAELADAVLISWLTDDAGSSEPALGDEQEPVVTGGAAAGSTHDDAWADVAEDPAAGPSIDIGTGTSGLESASSIESSGEAGGEGDPFAGIGEPSGGELAAAAGFTVTTAGGEDGSESEGQPPKKSPAASRRPHKKKSSPIGQLIGVIGGGALLIPIVFAILIWGFGRDPFQLTPLVPESLAFLLPAKFQPAGVSGPAAGSSLDAVLGDPNGVAGDESETPANLDLAANDSAGDSDDVADPLAFEPEPVDPEPAGPAATDLALIDTVGPSSGDDGLDDPLMALIDEAETAEAAVAPPEPEPEPLDLGSLREAVAGVSAALDAVAQMPDDPGDPDDKVRNRLLAKCYMALVGYAEALALLEQVSVESGRPFEPALEEAAGVRQGLADQPDVIELLPRLSRDWITYSRRTGDGVVTVGTLVASRRFGPSWRSQVSCTVPGNDTPDEIVVLSRGEPPVAPGDTVIVAGLTVDPDVVWAADIGPVEPARAEPPAATDIFGLPGL